MLTFSHWNVPEESALALSEALRQFVQTEYANGVYLWHTVTIFLLGHDIFFLLQRQNVPCSQ